MKSPLSSGKNSRGFTLIEIMVVVVIIGLLASMAIPTFNKMRRQSRQTAMISDGRIIGNAAQQFFLTTGTSQVEITYDPVTGIVTGDLTPWLKGITKNYEFGDNIIESGQSNAFSFRLPSAFEGVQVIFSEEGKTTHSSDQ